jgi:glycosyltransferase involved in cell wall biosynthesis
VTAALTVAIPFFRGIAYLEEAVAGVVAQHRPDWELVVVDDAGPDGAAAQHLVASYGDRRMRYVRNPVNLGLAGNWNRCVALAGAPLVSLLHADDRLLPGYVAAVLDAHERHPGTFGVFTGATVVDADGSPTFSPVDRVKQVLRPGCGEIVLEGEPGLTALLRGQFVMCPTLCYRTDALRAMPFDARWAQVLDLDLLARLLLAGEHLVGLPQPLYAYRRHRGQQTAVQTADASRFREELALHAELEGAAAGRGWHRAAATARLAPTVRAHLGLRAAADLAAGRRDAARAKAALLLGRHSSSPGGKV